MVHLSLLSHFFLPSSATVEEIKTSLSLTESRVGSVGASAPYIYNNLCNVYGIWAMVDF